MSTAPAAQGAEETEPRSELAFTARVGGHEVCLTVNYPMDHGAAALALLQQMGTPKRLAQVLEVLHDDASVQARLEEQGLVLEPADEFDGA